AAPAGSSNPAAPPSVPRSFPGGEAAGEVAVAEAATGRQEPAMSLEWIGAPTAKVGQPGDYTLLVRHSCNIPVQQVAVRIRVPAGLNVVSTEPKANNEGGVLNWDLGTLMARQERSLTIKMVAEAKGDVTPQAWVTFTGSSAFRVKIREPKLML